MKCIKIQVSLKARPISQSEVPNCWTRQSVVFLHMNKSNVDQFWLFQKFIKLFSKSLSFTTVL